MKDFTNLKNQIIEVEQEFTGAKTPGNRKKLPKAYLLVNFKPNTLNVDWGCGGYDEVTPFLEKSGIKNLRYDPYNVSKEENEATLDYIEQNNGADTIVLSNVLNVIKEESVRKNILINIKKCLKEDGVCYITAYEGDGKLRRSGVPTVTVNGYQSHRKLEDYMAEIKEVFPSCIRIGKLLICKQN